MTDLPSQIKRMRVAAGLSQEALAKKLGTSQSTIALWEKEGYENYTLGRLTELAEVCGYEILLTFRPWKGQ